MHLWNLIGSRHLKAEMSLTNWINRHVPSRKVTIKPNKTRHLYASVYFDLNLTFGLNSLSVFVMLICIVILIVLYFWKKITFSWIRISLVGDHRSIVLINEPPHDKTNKVTVRIQTRRSCAVIYTHFSWDYNDHSPDAAISSISFIFRFHEGP